MKIVLILFGAYVAFCVIAALVRGVIALVERAKYSCRLWNLGYRVSRIKVQTFDAELAKLKSESHALFERLRETHHIQNQSEAKAVSEYVQADTALRKSRRQKSKPPKAPRRRWGY
jgi:hypothetical protein